KAPALIDPLVLEARAQRISARTGRSPRLLDLGHRQPALLGRGRGRGLAFKILRINAALACSAERTRKCRPPSPTCAVIETRLLGGLNLRRRAATTVLILVGPVDIKMTGSTIVPKRAGSGNFLSIGVQSAVLHFADRRQSESAQRVSSCVTHTAQVPCLSTDTSRTNLAPDIHSSGSPSCRREGHGGQSVTECRAQKVTRLDARSEVEFPRRADCPASIERRILQ